MAELDNRIKYKFGHDELDLKDYIYNLGTNLLNYINSKKWNEGLQLEFINAYKNIISGFEDLLANNTNRFSTDDVGTIIDTKGIISNKDNDDIDPIGSEYYYNDSGNRITTDDYNLLKDKLKKNYNTFSANREVASYFNIIGNALKKYVKPELKQDSNSFNLSKHGFIPIWTTLLNPAGGDLDPTPYIEMDQIGENGVRETSKRALYLKELLTNYLANLPSYNYENTLFKDEATYKQRLLEAINGLENGYNSEDTIALNRAGIDSKFLNSYFSNEINLELKPKTELEELAELAIKEMLERAYNQLLLEKVNLNNLEKSDEEMNNYFDIYLKEHPFQSSVRGYTITPKYNYNLTVDYFINLDDPDALGNYIKDAKLSDYIRGKKLIKNGVDITKEHISNNLDLAYRAGLLKDIGNGFYAIPGSENYDNWTFLQYNPNTRLYEELSMLLNEALRKAMAYDFYKKNKEVQSKEEGGILKFEQGGYSLEYYNFVDLKRKEYKERKSKKLEEDIAKSGKTKEEYFNDQKPLEWTLADKARIASIIGDVTSLIASMTGIGSVASAGIGFASTAANQYADLLEGKGFWESTWNNAGSYALDALSLLPFAKAAKIPKMIKAIGRFAPHIISGINTIMAAGIVLKNGKEIKNSFEKITKGESLNVGDWKNIASGLLFVLGNTAAFNRARVANKRLRAAKTGEHYVKTEQGTIKVSPEKLKLLRKASTIEELNNILKDYEVTLAPKREGKLWNRKDSEKAIDIPDNPVYNLNKPVTLYSGDLKYTYKFGPGERTLGNLLIPSISLPGRNFYNKIFHPYAYRKNNQQINLEISTPTEISNNQVTSSIKPVSGPNIRQLRLWSNTPKYARILGYGRDFGIGYPKKTKKEIELGIELDKKGGTLNLSSIRKLAKGDQVTNTTSKANWFNDMFSSDPMKKWLDSYTLDNYEKFNDLLRSWSANKKATQYVPGATPLAWNQGVQDRQKEWELTGTNAAIEDLVTKGIITRSGNSGDNIEGGHVDGYFGELEYLRHGGTEESWKGHEDDLIKFQNILKERGLQYTLDPETGMYLMSPLLNTKSAELPQLSQKPESTNLNTALKLAEDSTESQSKGQVDIFSQIFSNPTITYGLPRALYADRINRRLTDMAKESITPLLKDPFEVHRYTRSDLDAEMQGERNYANLRRLASRPITSDGSLQTATLLLAEVLGQEARIAGKEKSNLVQRLYDELAWLQEKENAANRHETAMFNRALQWGAALDKNKSEQAYLSKKYNIWDTFGQLLEYDVRQKLLETKSLRDRFTLSDIHNSVIYDPNNYGANLTNLELEVWENVLSGTLPSSLDKEKLNLYISASKKVSKAETDLLKLYYNIPLSTWSNIRQFNAPFSASITVSKKNGGSLELAGIKAKTADAERFQRQIKECIDRNEKAIERLSKSMYGLIYKIK